MPEKIPWPFSRLYDRYPNRIFVKWFQLIAADVKNKAISGNIVDIGTGPGRLPVEIAKQAEKARVFGVDMSEDMIRIATKNAEKAGVGDRVEFRVRTAYDTGFENNSIDLVVSTGTLHHLSQPLNAFNEIYRILKRGGEAWLFDGRKDVTRAEFEETVRSLGIEKDIPLPIPVIERLWSKIHVGYKTEVYYSGKIGKAIKQSLFEKYNITTEGAFIRIELRKR
ncbi:MAG: class I SAM-dependent methyltransferase [Dehalococcoidia bacterium]|nr:class I SAM-dependent methyltransferase [Dehalococcoidia bacterium]